MRKAIIDSATAEVLNVAVVAEPQSWTPAIAERIIRAARPEYRWTDPKTGKIIIKEALPKESRHVLTLADHGFRPLSGPLLATGDLPPELAGDTWYFVKVIDDADFLLLDDPTGEPIVLTGGGDVTLTEAPFDPGAGKELIDPAGAVIGGMWDGEKFLPPPGPTPEEVREATAAKLDPARVLEALVVKTGAAADLDKDDRDAFDALREGRGEAAL